MKKLIFITLAFLLFSVRSYGLTIHGALINGTTAYVRDCNSNQQGINPVGDSITMGITGDPDQYAYRDHLQDMVGVGCFDILGGLSNPGSMSEDAKPGYDENHDGHSGKTCTYLRDNVFSIATKFDGYSDKTKSWIILLCGTNDIAACVDGPNAGQECTSVELDSIVSVIEDMVDDADLNEPNVNMIVMYPPQHNSVANDTSSNNLRSKLDTMIDSKQSGGKVNLYGLDLYEVFSDLGQSGGYSPYFYDANHPNDRGHQVIARAIYKILDGRCSEDDACNAP